jgi:hypothetical protein
MRMALQRWLDSPRSTLFASLTTLAIGLFFVFVWAPHPWSWQGIDQYDDLARALARGEPFGTTDVPWGYAYFVAAFYWLFPNSPWAAVTAQVVINALMPWLVYRLASPAVGRRVAALAAWITAIFSFNTIYASTQTSDSICTVLFLVTLLCFVHAHRMSRTWAYVAAGALSGLVPQFRPNMILLPVLVIAGYAFWPADAAKGRSGEVSPACPPKREARRWKLASKSASGGRFMHCAVFMLAMIAMLLPWVIRNYRYTGTIQPTSTHSGVQLWYGTLQVGPYLESRAHNPRSIFASAAFDYTSLERPIVISAKHYCPVGTSPQLAYRTDRDPALKRLAGSASAGNRREYQIPAQPAPSTVYYFFESGGVTFPERGDREPFIYFVSTDHLGDLDRHHELLDLFDIGRLMRHLAWQEPLPSEAPLDVNNDGRIDVADLRAIVAALIPQVADPLAGFDMNDRSAELRLSDGSTVAMPREFHGRQTDFDVNGNLAGDLISRHITFAALRAGAAPARASCAFAEDLTVNDVFYRREPHEMRRYTRLAFDNISRDPLAFLQASAYRMVRLFIVRPGTGDQATTFQYRGSRLIFNAGLILSSAYLAAFFAGVIIAWRARSPFLYALIPIAYVPLTICFVLTNMRYTITVQPLMFVFVALAVGWAAGLRSEAETDG